MAEKQCREPIEMICRRSWLDEAKGLYLIWGLVRDPSSIEPGMRLSIPWHPGFGMAFTIATVAVVCELQQEEFDEPNLAGFEIVVGIGPEEDEEEGESLLMAQWMNPHDELLLVWEPEAKITMAPHFRYGQNEIRHDVIEIPDCWKFRPKLPK